MQQLIPTKNCLDLTKAAEGCRLHAYPDPASGNLPITIGWGNTCRADGTKFKLGDTVTQSEADNLLQFTLNQKGKEVNHLLGSTVLTQNEFDALVDFEYNVGEGNLGGSSLLKMIKLNPANPAIAAEFMKWEYANHEIFNGLVHRRLAESKLYFTK